MNEDLTATEMLGGAGDTVENGPAPESVVTVTVTCDEHGYGMKVSGDRPVYVQSVKERGAAWRAGLRAGDRILRVGAVPVLHLTHQQVVHMIRAKPTTVLTVQQHGAHRTPITAPLPVNPEKQRQLELAKVNTLRLMIEQQHKYIRELRHHVSKVPDARKQEQLDAAERRCSVLQREIDAILATQGDNRGKNPSPLVRSRSSLDHLDHKYSRPLPPLPPPERDHVTPPPGTPPPPYATSTQPCADPQRAILSMEEDEPPPELPVCGGLFSNLRSVRESKLRTAVLLNWLIGERRRASANLLLIITDGYRASTGVTNHTLRRWAYEIQSTFLMPKAVLQLNGIDENMANEIEQVLLNEYDKDDLLRNVFRKARQKAKEELNQQLTEFQVKRQVGLGTLYGPEDAIIEKCDVDKQQEQVIVERLLCQRLSVLAEVCGADDDRGVLDENHALLSALIAAALTLHCRPASVAAAVGGSRATFLQRDKLYKQRTKRLAKQHSQPFVVRGHHLQLQALTAVGHCHHCEHVIWGLAPQAYVCTDCKLRVHRACAKAVEEGCCIDSDHHNNRISRFIERMHHAHSVERSFRKMEDDTACDETVTPASAQASELQHEGSKDEPAPPASIGDTKEHLEKDSNARLASKPRGVNRAESCRERDPPRRGKHRNASDPNRLTAHDRHDPESGSASAPPAASGSSSSSSLSSRSNGSNAVAAEQQDQSDWSEEEEPLPVQWADSLPPDTLHSMLLGPRMRKRQEVIHELIVTEGSHVRWLKVLGGVFLRPLENQPNLLPAEELHALFPNLPGVRERHSKLYGDLRAARNEAPNHVVQIRPIADAMLNTLGDSGYASCLSRFCRGQRMALDALRERRRKSKELHQFLCDREQLPLCERLQLRDMLACVWQRLTKYQLLLESILKTVSDDSAEEDIAEEDILRLKRAIEVTKEVLHSVDTAISAAENEHRLRSIQSKLEVRIPCAGPEWEEAKRLDLISRRLLMEGELSIRNDSKKNTVLALMLEDSLVLLQREGDKFVLRPIPQPSQQGLLSPHIRWDKVLFRPNAAVRNTFFLMNINGVQMHELSCNTASEYQLWIKRIQELPLAKPELKPSLTAALHTPQRSVDDSGINVSRNPSDASEKSSLNSPGNESGKPLDRRLSQDRDSVEKEQSGETEDRSCMGNEIAENHKSRRLTVGRVCLHSTEPPALPLVPPALLTVHPPTATSIAQNAYTYQERLRRLDEDISLALKAKTAVVSELLGIAPGNFGHFADMAVAETLGQIDVSKELREARLSQGSTAEDEVTVDDSKTNMHQLLLVAQAQANKLTEMLTKALRVNETTATEAWSTRGRCDSCKLRCRKADNDKCEEAHDCEASSVALAARLVGVTCGLQEALGRLLGALPALEAERRALRAELVVERERAGAVRLKAAAAHLDFVEMEKQALARECLQPQEF